LLDEIEILTGRQEGLRKAAAAADRRAESAEAAAALATAKAAGLEANNTRLQSQLDMAVAALQRTSHRCDELAREVQVQQQRASDAVAAGGGNNGGTVRGGHSADDLRRAKLLYQAEAAKSAELERQLALTQQKLLLADQAMAIEQQLRLSMQTHVEIVKQMDELAGGNVRDGGGRVAVARGSPIEEFDADASMLSNVAVGGDDDEDGDSGYVGGGGPSDGEYDDDTFADPDHVREEQDYVEREQGGEEERLSQEELEVMHATELLLTALNGKGVDEFGSAGDLVEFAVENSGTQLRAGGCSG
jgi:hypothetical protein